MVVMLKRLLRGGFFLRAGNGCRMPNPDFVGRRCAQMPGVELRIRTNNVEVNCLQTGFGQHKVLCLPGALGTVWTDFGAQIVGFDLDKFSLVVWDPPGYGNSRPPERDFSPGYLERDADTAAELLRTLNISSCSVLGWSDGGVTALFLAAKYPNMVKKLVVWGANAFFTDEDIDAYEKIRDVANWSPSMRNTLTNIYGEKGLARMMDEWVNSTRQMRKMNNGDICQKLVPSIECPTMILHGLKDPLVSRRHADYLHENIKNSRLHMLQDGKHDLHTKFAEFFNNIVQSFLEEK